MEKNIETAESLSKRISAILLKEWDPIGVQDSPEDLMNMIAMLCHCIKC
mgnify:CR=1 FL=1